MILSPELLKSKIPIFALGGGGGWQSTFDAESSIDKIQITIFAGQWGGGQLLMQSPEMLKSKIPIFASWGGGLVANF